MIMSLYPIVSADSRFAGMDQRQIGTVSSKNQHYNPSGLAHLRLSIFPVFGHRISCHETGSIVAPML